MLVCLQLEGFKNPAIFALEYTQIPEAHVGQQLDEVAAGWTYLSQTEGYPRIALIGDSNGATLILSLLLHIVHPYSKSVPIARRQPDAAIVISPLTRIAGPWNSSSSDYITQKVLDRYMRKYAQDFRADSTDPHVSPGLCRSKFWWSKAIPPRGGMYIIYGQEETLAPDIEELYQLVKNLGHVGRLAEPFEIHAWPIVQNYVAETKQKRLRGVTTVTSQLSKMLLWSTITEPPAEMLDEIRRETAEVYKLQHERIARIKEKATGVADNNQ
ncbi:hypothetical protein TRVA0_004S03444 [Trichomonascus vanleenenianus]|uniref:uncharacterized protein n=1 Tax=Trichomonascus vanleenenianus TaxID=2268995 RepID=UPI003EC9BF82